MRRRTRIAFTAKAASEAASEAALRCVIPIIRAFFRSLHTKNGRGIKNPREKGTLRLVDRETVLARE